MWIDGAVRQGWSGPPARNILPLTAASDERRIWIDAVRDVEERTDARAEAEWATPYSIAVPELHLELPSTAKVEGAQGKIDRNSLLKAIDASAGPQTGRGQTGGNPHWPQGNQNWATEFSNRLTQALADHVDDVIAKTRIASIDFSTMFGELAGSISSYVDEALNTLCSATAGLQGAQTCYGGGRPCFRPAPTSAIAICGRRSPPRRYQTAPLEPPAGRRRRIFFCELRFGATAAAVGGDGAIGRRRARAASQAVVDNRSPHPQH